VSGIENDDLVERIRTALNAPSVDSATIFASTRIDTTFNKIGDNADRATIESDSFIMSARQRGNCVYGPWFLGYRIIPSGGNIYYGQGLDESSSSSSDSSATSVSSASSNSSSSSSG